MSIALLGLIAFQVYWIKEAIRLGEDRFNQDVHDALERVSVRLEEGEIAGKTFEFLRAQQEAFSIGTDDSIIVLDVRRDRHSAENNPSHINQKFDFAFRLNEKFLEDESLNELVKNAEELQEEMERLNKEISFDIKIDSERVKQLASPQNLSIKTFSSGNKPLIEKKEFVSSVIDKIILSQQLEERIDATSIDSLITNELKNKGIDITYSFAVFSPSKDTFIVQKPHHVEKLEDSEYQVELFPNTQFQESSLLSLHFPNESQFILERTWFTLASSIFFIGVIISCFGFVLQVVIRQKKLSEVKNDFINNMTHEFKTPISTVALATEALRDPQIQGEQKMLSKYLKVIDEENKRLGSQVEKVLQLATMDKESLKLKKDLFDLQSVLEKQIDRIRLNIESRNGKIEEKFLAKNTHVTGDELHLTNAIFNVLDNAVKYTEEEPYISIQTKNIASGIIISISDNGIGIKSDDKEHIFDKFYRVHTGNLHNVKGFGLGLHYSKSIIKEHHGTIKVKSNKTSGCNFEIYLPHGKQ